MSKDFVFTCPGCRNFYYADAEGELYDEIPVQELCETCLEKEMK